MIPKVVLCRLRLHNLQVLARDRTVVRSHFSWARLSRLTPGKEFQCQLEGGPTVSLHAQRLIAPPLVSTGYYPPCDLGNTLYKFPCYSQGQQLKSGFRLTRKFGTAPGCGNQTEKAETEIFFSGLVVPDMEKRSCRVIVDDPAALKEKIVAIQEGGPGKCQVIADFDRTLTRFYVNGKLGQSCHSLLDQGDAEINKKKSELYDFYYPKEIDPGIPHDEKFNLMEEWWSKAHDLIVEGGVSYSDIESSVSKANIDFREGTVELFELLDQARIPLLIFSAGLADIIEEVMKQKLHRTFNSIRVVSNRMEFDTSGRVTGFKGKIIHVLNKNEHALEMAAPLHDEQHHAILEETSRGLESDVLRRSNVILLGDHLGDLGMSDGVNYENRITIGFLNDKVEENEASFSKAFDVVVLDDGPLDVVINVIQDILSSPKTASL